MKKILVVCTGNICRSPVGEAVLRRDLVATGFVEGEDFLIESAGTGPWHVGRAPDPRSQEVCREHDIDISSGRAQQVGISDGEHYDLILAMDADNFSALKSLIPEKCHRKISLFDDVSVEDPYYGGDEGFEVMFAQIEKASDRWVKWLKENK